MAHTVLNVKEWPAYVWHQIYSRMTKKAIMFYVLVGLLAIGGYDYALRTYENTCEMTYMYQYPEYIVSLAMNVGFISG